LLATLTRLLTWLLRLLTRLLVWLLIAVLLATLARLLRLVTMLLVRIIHCRYSYGVIALQPLRALLPSDGMFNSKLCVSYREIKGRVCAKPHTLQGSLCEQLI
jgi:hypothetical protein